MKTDSIPSLSIEIGSEAEISVTLQDRCERRKSVKSQNLCIICNQVKFKNDTKLFRLCEESRTETFLKTISFKLDEVYTCCSTYDSVDKLFAADILSHENCMKTYLQKFQREQLNDNKSIEEESGVFKNTFYELLSNLDLESKGYALSECRDFINEKLNDKQLTNRKLKKLLISHFGENICFTYPNDKTKSQMFFFCKHTSSRSCGNCSFY